MKILAIEASTRIDSSTNIALDRYLAEQKSCSVKKYRLKDMSLPLFVDERSDGKWITSPEIEMLVEEMAWADKIVLASPLYWYSVSHLMKNFMDHWTYYLQHSKHPLKEVVKDKKFSFIVVGYGEKSELTKPVFSILRQSIDFIGARIDDEIYLSEHSVRES